MEGHELNYSISGQRPFAAFCEHANETSASMRCGKFLDQLKNSVEFLEVDFPLWKQWSYRELELEMGIEKKEVLNRGQA